MKNISGQRKTACRFNIHKAVLSCRGDNPRFLILCITQYTRAIFSPYTFSIFFFCEILLFCYDSSNEKASLLFSYERLDVCLEFLPFRTHEPICCITQYLTVCITLFTLEIWCITLEKMEVNTEDEFFKKRTGYDDPKWTYG